MPHNPEYMPARFGVTSASIWFVPNEKYQKDPSAIPRVIALADNEGLVQVNPEFTRPHCMWCNNLGHTSINCNERKPLSTSTTTPGNKRSYALRDAVIITPTQWVPQELWNTPLSDMLMQDSPQNLPCFNIERTVPLPVGQPTKVIVTPLPAKPNVAKNNQKIGDNERSGDGYSRAKNPSKLLKTAVPAPSTTTVSINNKFEAIAFDKLKTFVDPDMGMEISNNSEDNMEDLSDSPPAPSKPTKKKQTRKKVKSTQKSTKLAKQSISAPAPLAQPTSTTITSINLKIPAKVTISKASNDNRKVNANTASSQSPVSSVAVPGSREPPNPTKPLVTVSVSKTGPAPPPGRIKIPSTFDKVGQGTSTATERTEYISPYAYRPTTKKTPLSGGGAK